MTDHWLPCGHTLNRDPEMQMAQFRREHPQHRGLVRFTPQSDGWVKIEFKGWVVPK